MPRCRSSVATALPFSDQATRRSSSAMSASRRSGRVRGVDIGDFARWSALIIASGRTQGRRVDRNGSPTARRWLSTATGAARFGQFIRAYWLPGIKTRGWMIITDTPAVGRQAFHFLVDIGAAHMPPQMQRRYVGRDGHDIYRVSVGSPASEGGRGRADEVRR